jgi:HSP20 family protein
MSTVIRWNPVRDMAAMQSAIDRLFDDSWRTVRPASAGNTLLLDVYETDTAYVVFSALPGINPDQINISLDDDILTISGEQPQPTFDEKENARGLLSERAYGKFSRSVRLGLPVDTDQIEASYENGILRLNLPKAAQAQPKQIRVRTTTATNNN